MRPNNLRRGAAFMVASALLFSAMGALVRQLSASLPNEMVVFARSAIGLLALLPWLLRNGVPRLATSHLKWHLTRGLAGLGAMYCYFFALAHMPMAEATLLNYSTPLFIPLIGLMWLHERTAPRVWFGIALGLLGVLFILKPGVGLFSSVAMIGLLAGILAAFAMVSIRRLTRTESTTRIVFYFSLISTLVSAVPLLWAWRTPPAILWLPLLVLGIVATAAQLLLTRAYAHAPAAEVGPFAYATVVFAAIIGWTIWGEVPDRWSLLGAVCVVAAGIYAIRMDARTAQQGPGPP